MAWTTREIRKCIVNEVRAHYRKDDESVVVTHSSHILHDFCGDLYDLAEIAQNLEGEFGLTLEINDMDQTVTELAKTIHQRLQTQTAPTTSS